MAAHQAPLSLGFSRQEHWSGLPFPSPMHESEKIEATDFLFLRSEITVDGDCSHEIRRRLLLGRKTMRNLDSVLKSKDITASQGPYSQRYGFSSSHTSSRCESCPRLGDHSVWVYLGYLSCSIDCISGFVPLPHYLDYYCLVVREGNGNPLQYSCLENFIDRGAW